MKTEKLKSEYRSLFGDLKYNIKERDLIRRKMRRVVSELSDCDALDCVIQLD